MLFNSIEFLFFLPITFVVFWLTPNKWRWIPALIASYFFYMYWNPKLVFLIVFTTIVSYSCGLLLERYNNHIIIKRIIVAVTLVASLGILLFFKYFNFIYDVFFDVIELFGAGDPSGYFSIILPVGISFYTFQTASYVIDVYKSDIKAEKHLGYFALFVIFFPQLVAGPIERPGDLIPQLKADKSIKKLDYTGAFRFMLVGFFKKIAVADFIGIIVNKTYENIEAANGLSAILSTALFAVQIYCDFSGYSDIAVGCAKLFGVELTENFNTPYVSKSVKEFWGRWHISLSHWLRDYIYFPLGGSRVKKVRWAFNLTLVFFISGLWHGANYNFIIWGLLHAFFQIFGAITLSGRNRIWKKLGKEPDGKLVSTLRVLFTCVLVGFAWIFFRAATPVGAITIIKKIFIDYSFSFEYISDTVSFLGLTVPVVLYTLFAIGMMFFLEKIKYPEKTKNITRYSSNVYSTLRFISYAVMIWCIICIWISLQAAEIGSSFIYFQF